MNPTNIPEPFDQLDALERNIENTPIPGAGGLTFQDPLGQMLDELEQDIETRVFNPPPLKQTSNVLDNLSQDHLPLQPQGQDTHHEQDVSVSPALPYYTETSQRPVPFHTPSHIPTGRIGRVGGRGFVNSSAGQGDKIYCPLEEGYVDIDFCQEQDCKYYDEDSDQDSGWRCTYYDEEHL